MSINLVIKKNMIATIFSVEDKKKSGANQVLFWKISFGDNNKVLDNQHDSLKSAIKEVRRLGFGGYKHITNKGKRKCRYLKDNTIMFGDEKDWRKIYFDAN
jgi:hypothetical protein